MEFRLKPSTKGNRQAMLPMLTHVPPDYSTEIICDHTQVQLFNLHALSITVLTVFNSCLLFSVQVRIF